MFGKKKGAFSIEKAACAHTYPPFFAKAPQVIADIHAYILTFANKERIRVAYYECYCNWITKDKAMSVDLREKFGGLSRTAYAAAVAGPLLAMSFFGAAQAQDQVAALNTPSTPAQTQTAPKGRPVLVRIGPGVHELDVKDLVRSITESNCELTTTTDRGFPGHFTIEVGEKRFKAPSAASAGHVAEDWCHEPEPTT